MKIYLHRATKSGNLHEGICHIIISDIYKAKLNRKHCLASVAEPSTVPFWQRHMYVKNTNRRLYRMSMSTMVT